jgi:hypothetical protein
MAINKKVLTTPEVIIFKTLMVIKSWPPLLKAKLEPTAEEMLNLLTANAH